MSNTRFYLSCPYAEKDDCKDNIERKWYVPSDLDREDFRRWWPDNVTDLSDFLGR